MNDRDKLVYNLALDRIKNVMPYSLKFLKNTKIEFKEYFDDIVGVSLPPNTGPTTIKLHLNRDITPYILTKPIHGTQRKVGEDNDGILIQIQVIPNFELKQLLLSFGDALEVMAPETFREEIMETIRKMKKIYGC
jgi:predicted DNA-binding transcriptional regulator YafY